MHGLHTTRDRPLHLGEDRPGNQVWGHASRQRVPILGGLGVCVRALRDLPGSSASAEPPIRFNSCAALRWRSLSIHGLVEYLSALVSGGSGRWSPYFRALYHFEAAISQLYLAYDGARKRLGGDYFASGDGSDLDRLNRVYNAGKHQIAKADQTLWITNDGVGSDDASILFVEIEDLLRSYARITNRITNQELAPDAADGAARS